MSVDQCRTHLGAAYMEVVGGRDQRPNMSLLKSRRLVQNKSLRGDRTATPGAFHTVTDIAGNTKILEPMFLVSRAVPLRELSLGEIEPPGVFHWYLDHESVLEVYGKSDWSEHLENFVENFTNIRLEMNQSSRGIPSHVRETDNSKKTHKWKVLRGWGSQGSRKLYGIVVTPEHVPDLSTNISSEMERTMEVKVPSPAR